MKKSIFNLGCILCLRWVPSRSTRRRGLKLQITVSVMNNYAKSNKKQLADVEVKKRAKWGWRRWQIKFARADINNAKMCKISGKVTHNWGHADTAAVISHDPSFPAWEWYHECTLAWNSCSNEQGKGREGSLYRAVPKWSRGGVLLRPLESSHQGQTLLVWKAQYIWNSSVLSVCIDVAG